MLDSDNAVVISLLFSTVLLYALLINWRRTRAKLERSEGKMELIEVEEHRMFEFLHTLGVALEEDHSASRLHREIVDGINAVVMSQGAALYLIDNSGRYLVPRAISDECPLLIGLPVEVLKKFQDDVRALKSHVRLSRVPAGEGMLGSVLSSGVTQSVVDVKNHEAFKDAFVQYTEEVKALVAPLKYGGKDLGVLAVARKADSPDYSGNEFDLFSSASEQAAFALGNAMVHQEANEKRKIEGELRNAREVQQVLLPSSQPNVKGYDISGVNHPARLISGDYYDYIDLGEGSWAVVIADVSGKGVAAGLLMAMCRSVLRLELERTGDPLGAVHQLNRQLYADIKEDSFISLALYVISELDNSVQVVRAGHDKAPLLRAASGEVEWVKPPGLAIGLDDGEVFERVTKLHQLELEPDDMLLLYTDGVTEARNEQDDELGADPMVNVLSRYARDGSQTVVSELESTIDKYVGNALQSDDITIIALQRKL